MHATLKATVSVGPSVGWSVSPSVCPTLLFFFRKVAYRVTCARLMAIGLVFGTMDFDLRIADYKDNLSDVSSPIWVWFAKKEQKDVSCRICNATIKRN